MPAHVTFALLAGTNDNRVYVFDCERKQSVTSFSGHGDDVNAVAYADDNPNVILSGSDDAFIRIWDRRVEGHRAQGMLIGG